VSGAGETIKINREETKNTKKERRKTFAVGLYLTVVSAMPDRKEITEQTEKTEQTENHENFPFVPSFPSVP